MRAAAVASLLGPYASLWDFPAMLADQGKPMNSLRSNSIGLALRADLGRLHFSAAQRRAVSDPSIALLMLVFCRIWIAAVHRILCVAYSGDGEYAHDWPRYGIVSTTLNISMDQHVVEWESRIGVDGSHTNRWFQDIIRDMSDADRLRLNREHKFATPPAILPKETGEWSLTKYTERGRMAIHAKEVAEAHNKDVEEGRLMWNLIFYSIVIGVLALGFWGSAKKRELQENNPTTPSSPFMTCMSLTSHQDRITCLDRAGLSNMIVEDQKEEVRRR